MKTLQQPAVRAIISIDCEQPVFAGTRKHTQYSYLQIDGEFIARNGLPLLERCSKGPAQQKQKPSFADDAECSYKHTVSIGKAAGCSSCNPRSASKASCMVIKAINGASWESNTPKQNSLQLDSQIPHLFCASALCHTVQAQDLDCAARQCAIK